MAKEKTYEPKEYIWELDLDGEDKLYKVLVTDTECITYEGDKEHKHLKVMNQLRKDNVLQIDTVTTVYGREVRFQLENGVPYIELDGVWQMSETNRRERIARLTKINTISAIVMLVAGLIPGVVAAVMWMRNGSIGKWWVLVALCILMIVNGLMSLSKLKMELNAIKEADEEAEKEKEARRAARERENG